MAPVVARVRRTCPAGVELVLGADGSCEGVRLAATPRVTCASMLADLVAVASASSRRIGVGRAPVATGEVGVGVYLLSEGFGAVDLLVVSHSWRDALATAREHLDAAPQPG